MNNSQFQKIVINRLDKIDSELDTIQSQLISDKTKYREKLAKELTALLPNTTQPHIKSDWKASWGGDAYSSHTLSTTDGYGNWCDINILNGKLNTNLNEKVSDMGKGFNGKEIIVRNPTDWNELKHIKSICHKFYKENFE